MSEEIKCKHDYGIKILPGLDVFTSGDPTCTKCGHVSRRYKSKAVVDATNYLLGFLDSNND